MCTAYLPTVAECLAALADAKAYWHAEDVETFLFGASIDAGVEADLFADEVKPVLLAA